MAEFRGFSLIGKFLLFASFFFSSCQSIDSYRDVEFDRSPSKIMIPAGADPLIVKIKSFFTRKGFTLISSSGGIVTKTVDSSTRVSGAEHNAKYIVNAEVEKIDWCITGGRMIAFSLSLVEVGSGREVLSMSGGRVCENKVFEQFVSELGY